MFQKELKLYCCFVICILFSFFISFDLIYHSPDFSDYYRYYNEIVKNKDLLEQRFEPLFYLITYIFSNVLEMNFSSFVFICTAFTLISKLFLTFKMNQESIWLYIVLYPMLGGVIFETIGLRVSLGLVFLLFAIYLNYNGRVVLSLIFLMISVCFHYSLFLGVFIFFIKYLLNKIQFKYLLSCIVLIFISSYFYMDDILLMLSSQSINPLVSDYLADDINKVDLFSIYFMFLYLIYMYGCYSFSTMNDLGRIYFILSCIFFAVAIIFSISAVMCFRYIDIAIILYLFSIISITVTSVRDKITLLVIILFSLYKIASVLYFSPVLI